MIDTNNQQPSSARRLSIAGILGRIGLAILLTVFLSWLIVQGDVVGEGGDCAGGWCGAELIVIAPVAVIIALVILFGTRPLRYGVGLVAILYGVVGIAWLVGNAWYRHPKVVPNAPKLPIHEINVNTGPGGPE